MVHPYILQAISEHNLHPSFCENVERWYKPLAEKIVARSQLYQEPLIVGVQGTQGSGKSTLSDFLKCIFSVEYSLNCAVLSIDDFYLTQLERQHLAKSVHPLLITRGVPGTHDVCLAHETIDKLIAIKSGEFAMIPRFSKITDDREPREQWSEVCGPVDIIILEGWCVGMMPQAKMDLIPHVNSLEEMEDSDRIWRNYVNQQLLEPYQTLFNRLNCLAVLNAPSFSCVFEWRLLQEQKLAVKLTADGRRDESQKLLTGEKVKRFIAHYQRLTEFGLEELPKKADWLMRLDLSHNIISLEEKIE